MCSMLPAPRRAHPTSALPRGCVCTENRLIPENAVLGREELSQTIKIPSYPMEKAVLEDLVWLLPHCMPAMPLLGHEAPQLFLQQLDAQPSLLLRA